MHTRTECLAFFFAFASLRNGFGFGMAGYGCGGGGGFKKRVWEVPISKSCNQIQNQKSGPFLVAVLLSTSN
jgi:hypothetical protein